MDEPHIVCRFPQEWAAREEEQKAERPKAKPVHHNWFQGSTDVTAVLAHRGM